VAPDGRRVVSASADRRLKVWDTVASRAVVPFEGHVKSVTGCAVTPDGERVVSASADRTLKVWDLDSGRALATFKGHTGNVIACAVTPDGGRVVSASSSGKLRVWDLERGRILATLQGHTLGVTACAVVPDGGRAISASWDQTLKVWDLAYKIRPFRAMPGNTKTPAQMRAVFVVTTCPLKRSGNSWGTVGRYELRSLGDRGARSTVQHGPAPAPRAGGSGPGRSVAVRRHRLEIRVPKMRRDECASHAPLGRQGG